ncbi:MAG: response regulator transcription factor [Propionibacteriaceae bacterium]|nr:response regulator transcription factor [Propionibacteriaceae bacterium]
MPRILVVDDDPTVREVVVSYLRAADFEVYEAVDGLDALASAQQHRPDLVVLDLSLPRLDGLEVFRRLRQDHGSTPVVMLTARGEEPDRILGLEIGADDYIAKPFSPRELVLRVRSVLRRTQAPVTADVIADADLELSVTSRSVRLRGQPIGLASREFDLLHHFVCHPGVAFTREELMREVWGWEFGDQTTVTVHVRRLREKIEDDPSAPRRLVTVWGRGYRWDAS